MSWWFIKTAGETGHSQNLVQPYPRNQGPEAADEAHRKIVVVL